MEVLFKFCDKVPGEVRCLITTEQGLKKSKTVPTDEFIKIVTDVTPKRLLRLGSLPSGYIDGMVSPVGEPNWKVVVRLPGDIRTFLYRGKSYVIPEPDLVFKFEVSGGYIHKSFCAVAIGQELFHYPFGNVYPDGRICFGNMRLQDLASIKDAERIISAFIGGETNDDLYNPVKVKVGRKKMELDQRQLLEFLNGKGEWPKEVALMPYERTVSDIVASMSEKC